MPASFERNVAAARKNFQLARHFCCACHKFPFDAVTSGNCEFLDNWKSAKKENGKLLICRTAAASLLPPSPPLFHNDMSEHVNWRSSAILWITTDPNKGICMCVCVCNSPASPYLIIVVPGSARAVAVSAAADANNNNNKQKTSSKRCRQRSHSSRRSCCALPSVTVAVAAVAAACWNLPMNR